VNSNENEFHVFENELETRETRFLRASPPSDVKVSKAKAEIRHLSSHKSDFQVDMREIGIAPSPSEAGTRFFRASPSPSPSNGKGLEDDNIHFASDKREFDVNVSDIGSELESRFFRASPEGKASMSGATTAGHSNNFLISDPLVIGNFQNNNSLIRNSTRTHTVKKDKTFDLKNRVAWPSSSTRINNERPKQHISQIYNTKEVVLDSESVYIRDNFTDDGNIRSSMNINRADKRENIGLSPISNDSPSELDGGAFPSSASSSSSSASVSRKQHRYEHRTFQSQQSRHFTSSEIRENSDTITTSMLRETGNIKSYINRTATLPVPVPHVSRLRERYSRPDRFEDTYAASTFSNFSPNFSTSTGNDYDDTSVSRSLLEKFDYESTPESTSKGRRFAV